VATLTPNLNEIKLLLDEKVVEFNIVAFIEKDPILIPHQFEKKEDIEIAAFLTATIAWGQRISIVKNASKLMSLLHNQPFDFVLNCSEKDLKPLQYFVHRTFQGVDCICFIKALKNIYDNHGGLENVFTHEFQKNQSIYSCLQGFRNVFFEVDHPTRTLKHVSDVSKNASAKRLNMFLRWMVRSDNKGVDFGIWKSIPTSSLMLPLDIHTGNVARELGLLTRKQNDWTAVEELTQVLRTFDPIDPIKYDFALFGMGVNRQLAINNE
jgi:uncharacterized protein (TIGR02757 family)